MDVLQNTAANDVVKYLVGNKLDLISNRQMTVTVDKGKVITFSQPNDFHGFAECSALNNIIVEQMFMSMCTTLYKRKKSSVEDKNHKTFIITNQNKKDFCCF